MSPCPCQSGKKYMDCCGVFISGKTLPATCEMLMRSRYTAYTQANVEYIAQTMKGRAAKGFNKKETESWAKQVTWEGLEVMSSKEQIPTGWVEFIASYSYQGKKFKIHELSEFCLEGGRWFYVDGKEL